MLSDTLFEAAEDIRKYQLEYPEIYTPLQERLDLVTGEMDNIRTFLDKVPTDDLIPPDHGQPADVNIDDQLYKITLTDTIYVPKQYEPKRTVPLTYGGEGRIVGFTLPDGRTIRPQIGYEISDSNDDNHQDMSYQQLIDLGILSGDDVSTTIHEAD